LLGTPEVAGVRTISVQNQLAVISALPLLGSMIDGLLDEVEQQYVNLLACRPQPHVLDN
jgi:hypothetical protein